MSWGFAEGQSVFASDEATYDSMFNVPGVAFVASTGDFGAADPEYPAYSPNVLAVGGTSLTLNADGSYNSETGWGYQSQLLSLTSIQPDRPRSIRACSMNIARPKRGRGEFTTRSWMKWPVT
jgi:subtilase family serine protease